MNFLSWNKTKKYPKKRVFSLIVEFILFPALGVHKQVKQSNPDLGLGFGEFSILRFGHNIPSIVLEDLSFALLSGSEPGSFLNEGHEDGINVRLDDDVVDDTDL
jgi:hypothetical protein